jgi:hypothetical protein
VTLPTSNQQIGTKIRGVGEQGIRDGETGDHGVRRCGIDYVASEMAGDVGGRIIRI